MLQHMVTILVCYGGHFESKMAAKIQKSSDLEKIWFTSKSWSCELIIVIVFGNGSHGVG
jgi:RNase P/RNase MRP subunit p30